MGKLQDKKRRKRRERNGNDDCYTASLLQAMRWNDYSSLYVAAWFVVIGAFWCNVIGAF